MSETSIEKRDRFEDDDLRSVTSFADAVRLVGKDVIEDFSEAYGSGFTVLPTDEKSRLIRVPFFVIEWRFSEGDNGEFVSALIVTEPGEKLVLNDGSTGIRDQFHTITAKRLERGASDADAHRGLIVRNGLRVSLYDYTDEKSGKTSKASTYYLAN